jgi:hypothetical protein
LGGWLAPVFFFWRGAKLRKFWSFLFCFVFLVQIRLLLLIKKSPKFWHKILFKKKKNARYVHSRHRRRKPRVKSGRVTVQVDGYWVHNRHRVRIFRVEELRELAGGGVRAEESKGQFQ